MEVSEMNKLNSQILTHQSPKSTCKDYLQVQKGAKA